MNFSQSLELQADILDVAQQYSWQSSMQQRDDPLFVSSTRNRFNTEAFFRAQTLLHPDVTSFASVTRESYFSAGKEAGLTTVSLQGKTLAMELSPNDSLASKVDLSNGMSPSWTIQESTWNLSLGDGFSMMTTTFKVEGIQNPFEAVETQTATATLSDDLHFASQRTNWTLESTLFNQTHSWSSATMQPFSLGEEPTMNAPSFASNFAMRQETQTMTFESQSPLGNWQFHQTLTKTRSMQAMESVPGLELEPATSLRSDNSKITCELNPSFELSVLRTDTLLAAMPDLKLQSGQPVAMGLLSVGLG